MVRGIFFRLISNTGGGYCFYKDAKLLRLTRYRYNEAPLDSNGHYFYINDGGCVWSVGWQPVRAELDRYVCRHGLGYTILESAKNGLCCKAGDVRSKRRQLRTQPRHADQ